MPELDDLLVPDLDLVVCGFAVGTKSYEEKAYYAGPGNKFWMSLKEVGLTQGLLRPEEFRQLLTFRIGLTDLVKDQSGGDAVLDFSRDGSSLLRARMLDLRPGVPSLGLGTVEYGTCEEVIGRTLLFVAPSTRARADRYWDVIYWKSVSQLIRSVRNARSTL